MRRKKGFFDPVKYSWKSSVALWTRRQLPGTPLALPDDRRIPTPSGAHNEKILRRRVLFMKPGAAVVVIPGKTTQNFIRAFWWRWKSKWVAISRFPNSDGQTRKMPDSHRRPTILFSGKTVRRWLVQLTWSVIIVSETSCCIIRLSSKLRRGRNRHLV